MTPFRCLLDLVNSPKNEKNMKIEASISLIRRDEDVLFKWLVKNLYKSTVYRRKWQTRNFV